LGRHITQSSQRGQNPEFETATHSTEIAPL
jgi:hypothetical protein